MRDDEQRIEAEGIDSAMEKRFALVVGVNTSIRSPYRTPLKYAEEDAYAMAQTLESPACKFVLHKPALRGQEATSNDVKRAIVELIKESSHQDFLCFYFSGHAQSVKVKGDRQEIYFVTHDFSESDVAIDPTLHLSMKWLWDILYQQAEVQKILLVLDCCYAGNMLTTGPDSYQIDLRKLFKDYLEDENVKESTNRSRFILAATGYDTAAYEQDSQGIQHGHSIMTEFILKALRGDDMRAYDNEGFLDILALHTYLQNVVRGQQPELLAMGRQRCLLAWYSPRLRDEAQKKDKLVYTEADFFERFGEITTTSHKRTFDHTLCRDASLADIKLEAVADFFQKERVQQQPDFYPGITDQELLEQFGLQQEAFLTYGALLCFGKNPSKWISGATMRCISRKGNNRYGGWEEDRFFRGSLLEQFELGIEFLQRHLRLRRVIRAQGSVEELEIPPIALREVLANALIHREYANQTNFVQVELFDNRIEISSPGNLPVGLTIPQLGGEIQYPLRNPQIARVFYLCNYVEEAGTGISRTQQAMREARLPQPHFAVHGGRAFSVVLRRPQLTTPQLTASPWFSALRKAVDSKQGYQLVSFVLTTMLLIMLFASNFSRFFPASPISNPSFASSIGVISAPDGETIGISDGTFAFDTGSGRVDGQLKILAASKLKQGNAVNASSLFTQATTMDTNDAEARIYLEDQRVLASHAPYITFVVATLLDSNQSDLSTGRDNLQGAYVAQKEYNDGAKLGNVQVYLLIANAGGNSSYATTVARQIVQAAQQDHHIVGVMGWPYSSYVETSYSILANAHIPMVSPTASSDSLSNISPYFFRVAPANNVQAIAGAHYAEQQLRATRAALFVDPSDTYSQNLAADFEKQFTADGNQVVATENYTEGQTANLASLLQNALNTSPAPDLIYFSGYAADLSVLLTDLPPSASNVELMGGDGLYQLGGYSSSARAGFERLHFTVFAYPDEWDYLQRVNTFFSSYANDFDPLQVHPAGLYGYERADNDAILSYDATITLLQGSANVLGNQTTTTPDALRRGLSMITGANALQGVSGQISFGSNNDPLNKAVVILAVDAVGHIQLISTSSGAIQGCFLLGQCR